MHILFEGVTLETLIKFNRLKQLSTDAKVIIDALKKSTSDLLEVITFEIDKTLTYCDISSWKFSSFKMSQRFMKLCFELHIKKPVLDEPFVY